MQAGQNITFGRFRLDLTNECLWQGTRAISLRPKAFAVLKLLVERPGLLVTKQQVLDAVWPDTFVGDAVLKDNIRQLREALHDDAAEPVYIETAHRRGYRFIGKLSEPASKNPAVLSISREFESFVQYRGYCSVQRHPRSAGPGRRVGETAHVARAGAGWRTSNCVCYWRTWNRKDHPGSRFSASSFSARRQCL